MEYNQYCDYKNSNGELWLTIAVFIIIILSLNQHFISVYDVNPFVGVFNVTAVEVVDDI